MVLDNFICKKVCPIEIFRYSLVSFCKDIVHIWVAQNPEATKEELGTTVPCLTNTTRSFLTPLF